MAERNKDQAKENPESVASSNSSPSMKDVNLSPEHNSMISDRNVFNTPEMFSTHEDTVSTYFLPMSAAKDPSMRHD